MKYLSITKFLSAAFTIITVSATTSQAHDPWTPGRPDGHAPTGVMVNHYHNKNEGMFSYRFMNMHMEGNRMGTDQLSVSEVAFGTGVGYPVIPTQMDMQMHMFGTMYAVSDNLTLMVMVPYKSITMDHVVASAPPPPLAGLAGQTFSTESDGLGDVKINGLIKLYNQNRHSLHLNLGLSLPSGSIDERGEAPIPGGGGGSFGQVLLPYPMQLGSGTVDFMPGLTYLGQTANWSWGAQTMGTLRIDDNRQGYALGDSIEGSTWIARRFNDSVSGSFRLKSLTWGNYEGRDQRIPTLPLPTVFGVPTADPNRRGGTRLDALMGVNYYFRSGWLKGHRVSVEGGLPIYQNLDGPQLETDWIMSVGWEYAF
jgi:hypothetical protein